MANPPSRHRTWRGCVALLAAGGCVALACSSNDAPTGGHGGGSGGTAPSTGGAMSIAGSGAKGGTGASGGTMPTGAGGSGPAGTGGSSVSGTGGTSTQGGSGSGGTTTTGGSAGMTTAGAPSGGAPNPGTGGTGGVTNGGAGTSGGSAGAATAGAGGAPGGGMGGSGGSSTASFTCNEIIGIDSTSEWYTAGFETYVPDGKWQLIYFHPGYVEDWGDATDPVWTTPTTMSGTSAPTLVSPCTTNSDNPDRVIFNMFADGSDTNITNKAAFAAALDKVITQIKAHYSRVKRIDLLTMTRAPMNMACSSSNAAGSMIPQYYDDAVQMEVASGPPAIVASPPFFAPDCTDFDSTGGPHFSDAGKPIIGTLYGKYYSTEP